MNKVTYIYYFVESSYQPWGLLYLLFQKEKLMLSNISPNYKAFKRQCHDWNRNLGQAQILCLFHQAPLFLVKCSCSLFVWRGDVAANWFLHGLPCDCNSSQTTYTPALHILQVTLFPLSFSPSSSKVMKLELKLQLICYFPFCVCCINLLLVTTPDHILNYYINLENLCIKPWQAQIHCCYSR